MNKEDIMIYAVGHKAMDTLKHRGYEIVSDDSEMTTSQSMMMPES